MNLNLFQINWLNDYSVFFPYFYFSVFSQKVTQPHPPPSRPPCRCNRNNSAHYRLVSYHYSVSHFTLGFTDDCISVGTNRDSKTFTVFICAVLTVEWSFLSNVQKWVKQSTTQNANACIYLFFGKTCRFSVAEYHKHLINQRRNISIFLLIPVKLHSCIIFDFFIMT